MVASDSIRIRLAGGSRDVLLRSPPTESSLSLLRTTPWIVVLSGVCKGTSLPISCCDFPSGKLTSHSFDPTPTHLYNSEDGLRLLGSLHSLLYSRFFRIRRRNQRIRRKFHSHRFWDSFGARVRGTRWFFINIAGFNFPRQRIGCGGFWAFGMVHGIAKACIIAWLCLLREIYRGYFKWLPNTYYFLWYRSDLLLTANIATRTSVNWESSV